MTISQKNFTILNPELKMGDIMEENSLLIENFGPVKKANIDITPLTIFIGPNSSGKSYSSLLIHSLLNSYNELGSDLHNKIEDSIKKFLENDDKLSMEFKDLLSKYVNSEPEFSDNAFKYPAEKFKIILEKSFGYVFNNLVEDKLKENFSNNLNKLNQFNKYPFKFSFNNNSFVNEDGNLILNDFHIEVRLE